LTLSGLLGSVHPVMNTRRTIPASILSEAAVIPALVALLIALLAGGLSGCQGAKKGSGASLPIKNIQVDASLLGQAVTDSTLRFTFRPPSFFQPGNPERVKQIQEAVRRGQKPDDPMAAEPILIFGRPDRPGSVCTVSRFLKAPQGGMTPEWIEALRKSTKETVESATVQDELYRVGNMAVLQLVIRNPQMVLFRAICQEPRHEPVRLDFLIPAGEYEGSVRALESSVGSIAMF
jgi:hypothetical protein